jgi:hypothetical protein
MEPTIIPATTTGNEPLIPSASIEVDSPLAGIFSNLGIDIGSYLSLETIISIFDWLWSIYAIIAYLLCIIMLILYVYAATRYKQLSEMRDEMVKERERIWDERFRSGPRNNRLEDMLAHIESENPNDWKLAIIEADIILDTALKEAGYAGVSLGERLKSIAPSQLQSLDDAWQAHKVRNQVAHGGADFVLTRRLAEETIKQYRRVFNELGV